MKESLRHLADVSSELDDDVLYRWIGSPPHEDARRAYDAFVPILGFILTFPYYNDLFLAYPDDPTEDPDPLRDVINEHVAEDRTHARLFLRDLRRLGLAAVWGIRRPSTALWTLWVSPMLDPAQAVLSRRIRTLVGDADAWPPIRYLHIEQLEQDGHLLFSAAAARAPAVFAQTGVEPLYFGGFHLERESGHVGGSEFADVVLSPEQSAHARQVVADKHAASVEMNALMHGFAVSAQELDHTGTLLVREQEERLRHTRRRVAAHLAGEVPAPAWHIRPHRTTHQKDLLAAWRGHHDRFVSHPFTDLLRTADGPEARFALRCAALLFAARICMLHSFYRFDCLPTDGTAPGADAVRFVAETFSTEAQLFFHDWQVLEMDEHLPWDLPELLEWIFFDPTYGRPEMEALHELRRQAMRVDDPVVRYWALMAVHSMSRPFFAATAPATAAFAREHPDRPPLVYLGGVHHLHYDEAVADWLAPDHPTSLAHLPVTDEQRCRALELMDVVARVGRRQFDNLAAALTTDRSRFGFLRD